MKSHYKRIGDYVTQIKLKNTDGVISLLRGISINKHFMPSVANIIGTDLSKYRVVKKNQFAFNPMHVGRDEVLPISMLENNSPVIVSPAYIVFKIKNEEVLLPEYMMMWCKRSEFDRNAWFMTDSSVRGGFSWADFCDMGIPIPSIEKQHEIVREYNIVNDRILLNEQLTKALEDTAQTIYKKWFIDFDFPISKHYAKSINKLELEGLPYKSCGGEMRYCENLLKEIPVGSLVSTLGDVCALITDGKHGNCEDYLNSSYYFISVKDIQNGAINYSDARQIIRSDFEETHRRTAFSAGDILFTNTGSIGRMVILEDDPITYRTTCQKSVAILKPSHEKIDTYFLYSFLKNSVVELQELAGGTSQANLLLGDMRSFLILIPEKEYRLLFSNSVKKIFIHFHLLNKEQIQLQKLKNIILQKMSKA